MSIQFIRTDDRFIHGQVTTGWARQMGIDHIALVNDGIAKNSIIMKLQQASAGQNIIVKFFSVEQAIAAIQEGNFCTHGKYFLLLENRKGSLFSWLSANCLEFLWQVNFLKLSDIPVLYQQLHWLLQLP